MARFVQVLAAVVVLGVGVAAQTPDGAWSFDMNSPMGSVTAKVQLKADDGKLSGEFDMGGGRVWPIENGTIKDREIFFTINRDGKMTYEMRGALDGDTIKGAAAAMGTTVDWVMTRAR